jgi:hypothetical protein
MSVRVKRRSTRKEYMFSAVHPTTDIRPDDPDPETIALRVTVIGGQHDADDYIVIWRDMTVGRIMRAPGLPPHVPQWRWTCNVYRKPGGDSGTGTDLDGVMTASLPTALLRLRALLAHGRRLDQFNMANA